MASPTVGVMGAGAIGCYVGGHIARTGRARVVLVGRPRVGEAIAADGLTLRRFSEPPIRIDDDSFEFATSADALADCDVILVCVKRLQSDEVGRQLASVVRPGCAVVSLQNGLGGADQLAAASGADSVLDAVVGFNVVWRDGCEFQQTTSGDVLVESSANEAVDDALAALSSAGVGARSVQRIQRHQRSKLLLNLNNALGALSGATTPTLVLDRGYRRAARALVREGLKVYRAAGLRTARINGFPPQFIAGVLGMPTPLVRLVARSQFKLDPDARSSMWHDLSRDRATEVDYLNGEIVRIAAAAGAQAPLNQRIVGLVHDAEAQQSGCPEQSPQALLEALALAT